VNATGTLGETRKDQRTVNVRATRTVKGIMSGTGTRRRTGTDLVAMAHKAAMATVAIEARERAQAEPVEGRVHAAIPRSVLKTAADGHWRNAWDSKGFRKGSKSAAIPIIVSFLVNVVKFVSI